MNNLPWSWKADTILILFSFMVMYVRMKEYNLRDENFGFKSEIGHQVFE